MILADLRQYLKQRQRVSLKDLCGHFQVEADALRGMLAIWVNKGKLRKLPLAENCGSSCCKCDTALTELYEWIE